MLAQSTEEFVFSAESGVSVEEQQAIMRQIEEITQRGRVEETEFSRIKAGKKGYVFPLLVNAAAFGLLLIAVLIAFLCWNLPAAKRIETHQELNSAEGKLIQEIRRQSTVRIGEKEGEIANVVDKISELTEERENLIVRLETHAEQRSELSPRIEALAAEVTILKERLAWLQKERRELVVQGRNQEAELFVRKTDPENAAALEELRNLNAEEERFAFFEQQLRASYKQIQENVREGKIDAAQNDMRALRDFMQNPVFAGNRLVQAQRDVNSAGVEALSEVIGLVTGDTFSKAEQEWLSQKNTLNRQIASLKYQNNQLEKDIAFLQPDIQYAELKKRDTELTVLRTVINSRDNTIAGNEKTMSEQQAAIDALNQTKASLEAALARRDEQITGLRAQIAAFVRDISDRDKMISELQSDSEHQRETIAERDATINTQQDQIAGHQRTIMDREKTIADLRTESANQRQTIAERDRAIAQNRTQITIQQQQINERERNLNEQRVQMENQQQTLTELNKVVEDLRGQTSGSNQIVAERERQIAQLRSENARVQQTVAERDASMATLNTQIAVLNQSISERERTITQLRTQIQNQQQTIAERDRSIQLLMNSQ